MFCIVLWYIYCTDLIYIECRVRASTARTLVLFASNQCGLYAALANNLNPALHCTNPGKQPTGAASTPALHLQL